MLYDILKQYNIHNIEGTVQEKVPVIVSSHYEEALLDWAPFSDLPRVLAEHFWYLNIPDFERISTYAHGVSPSQDWIFSNSVVDYTFNYVREAHQNGLAVHPYSFSLDRLPKKEGRIEKWVNSGVDGIINEWPSYVYEQTLVTGTKSILTGQL